MYLDNLLAKLKFCIITVLLGFVFTSGVVLAQPDQNKLFYGPVSGWILYYTDADLDGWHDPGEAFFAGPGGNDWNPDNSCWMASASNLLVDGGYANPYNPGWLRFGGAPSPNVSPWGAGVNAGGGGAFMTFDDCGWQHWAIAHTGLAFQGPIISVAEFGAGTWAINPINWCLARFAEGHAVGLTVWWGAPAVGALPGRVDLTLNWGYHAITLYGINEAAGTITITDSDDRVVGARVCNYTFIGNDWVIQNLYPGINAHVNYAVALQQRHIPSLTQWGLIGLMLVLLSIATWVFFRRKRVVGVRT